VKLLPQPKNVFLLIIISVVCFIMLSMYYNSPLLISFDHYVIEKVTHFLPVALASFFIMITNIGSVLITLPALFIISVYFTLKREFLFLVLVILNFNGVRMLNRLLKSHFERERPPIIDHIVKVHSFSFPSGHSMNSIAFYGLLCWLLLQTPISQKKYVRIMIVSLFSSLIFLIGISRMYLRVHYPTDVIAGFLAGSCWLVALIASYQWIHSYIGRKNMLSY
jgi:undecaprenyl-diphosphatase